LNKMTRGLFIVVSAPSGAGKTSICREFLRACPQVNFSVSYTTRKPRSIEVEGKDYFFVSREEFQRRVAENAFIEWTENYGNYYGTSVKVVEETLALGNDLLLDVEPGGARNLKKSVKGGVFVFILPPSKEDLLNRLRKRGCETENDISRRLARAEEELKEVSWYDYIIFNSELATAAEQLKSIYLAEKCRRTRLAGKIKQFMKNN